MVKISIIVPVYKVENYLAACLESLMHQTLHEIEIICIDDASPDNSSAVLEKYRQKDKRMHVVSLSENRGTLYARMEGIRQAVGKYLIFLDSDDYLDTNACEELYIQMEQQKVDVLHFGTSLHLSQNVSDQMAGWVEQFLTPYEGRIENEDILTACFTEDKFDFNITNKIWKKEVCKKAVSFIECEKLVSSEDRYTFFVFAFFAKTYFGIREKYYQYNLGIGVTGGDYLSLEQFEKRCSGVTASKLADTFLNRTGKQEQYAEVSREFANKILWDCIDCWHNKLAPHDYQQGFQILRTYFAPNEVVKAVARVYFEQGKDIFERAGLQSGKRIAVFYRYLGYCNMDEKIVNYIHSLKARGCQIKLYTDYDRKGKLPDEFHYGVDIVYLPESWSANWDQYETRCNALFEQLKKDKTEVVLYASPTSHIYWLDTLLITLCDITVIELNDEIYLDYYGNKIQELNQKIELLKQECTSLQAEYESPKRMLMHFFTSLKRKILRQFKAE